jgi:Tfp pilus assembly protein PilV
MRPARHTVRGISLIEAVVALAVMAFGMLAYVGIQSSLRFNSDVAKQRSEAVRIAQEAIERWRAYSFVATNVDETDYAEIATVAAQNLNQPNVNTTFTMTRTVVDAATTPAAPRMKTLVVDVGWQDRNGEPQSVRLSTTIAASPPELAGSLSVPGAGGPLRLPQGRNAGIPAVATDVGGGRSAFAPRGAVAPVVWLFDNLSGVITSVCTFPLGADESQLVNANNCINAPSWLISGFVRFSPGEHPEAAAPIGEQIALGMQAVAVGVAFADGECIVAPVQDPKLTYTSYACRVPQSADTTWTGTTRLSLPLDLDQYDVCRYSNGAAGNASHPQVYVGLDRPLGNQNFLVVSEGIACPAGTLPHQPPP